MSLYHKSLMVGVSRMPLAGIHQYVGAAHSAKESFSALNMP